MTSENKDTYECSECDEVFSVLSDLEEHLKSHNERKPCISNSGQNMYKCDHCFKDILNVRDFKLHLNCYKTVPPFTCVACDEFCGSNTGLDVHDRMDSIGEGISVIEAHNSQNHLPVHKKGKFKRTKPYKCNYCHRSFANLLSFNTHTGMYKERKTHSCNFCMTTAKCHDILEFHLKSQHADITKPYKCNVCNKNYASLSELNNHKAAHEVNSLFRGSINNELFTGKQDFKIEVDDDNIDKSFTCEICNKTFSLRANLKYHIRQKHEQKESFKCVFCSKSFDSKFYHDKHLKSHSDGKERFECDVCFKTFRSKLTFQSHLREHYEKYSCQQCEKSFQFKSLLQDHIKTHSELGPFICNFCKTLLKCSRNLERHIFTQHTMEMMFKCSLCDRAFANHYVMVRHTRKVHLGEKYECNECSKLFTQLHELKCHELLHCRIKSTTCKFCGEIYVCEYRLQVHMLKHSGDKNGTCKESSVCQSNVQTEQVEDSLNCNVKMESKILTTGENPVSNVSATEPFVFESCGENIKDEITVKLEGDIKIENNSFEPDCPTNVDYLNDVDGDSDFQTMKTE